MSRESKHRHVAIESIDTENNVLVWAGRKISDIAEEVGHTPFYCYDRD